MLVCLGRCYQVPQVPGRCDLVLSSRQVRSRTVNSRKEPGCLKIQAGAIVLGRRGKRHQVT